MKPFDSDVWTGFWVSNLLLHIIFMHDLYVHINTWIVPTSPDVGAVDWGHDEAELSPHIHQLLQQVTGKSLIFHEAEQPDAPLMLQYAWFLADHLSNSFSDTSEERDNFLEQVRVLIFVNLLGSWGLHVESEHCSQDKWDNYTALDGTSVTNDFSFLLVRAQTNTVVSNEECVCCADRFMLVFMGLQVRHQRSLWQKWQSYMKETHSLGKEPKRKTTVVYIHSSQSSKSEK